MARRFGRQEIIARKGISQKGIKKGRKEIRQKEDLALGQEGVSGTEIRQTGNYSQTGY